MSAPDASRRSPDSDNIRLWYWIIGSFLVVLAIVGLVTYSGKKDDAAAQQKAAELTQAFEQAGLTVPVNEDVFIRSFGTDGGAVCENPANALGRATLHDQMTNGGSFVGRRPVIVDRRILVGGALILQTYCPEKLEEFKEKTDELKTDDVIKR
ncbi:hypothetical protein OJ998_10880 [Solirubrobacter taibaiensis]|nr:hypothetical protein [Solirubrobacter taibaiensis]